MNALEQEYADNLRRTRDREARRPQWLPLTYGVGGLGLCGSLIAMDGFTPRNVVLLVSMCGMLAVTIALPFIRFPTPNGDTAQTPAQAPVDCGGYREAPRAQSTVAPSPHRGILRVALLVVVAGALVTFCAWQNVFIDATIYAGTFAVMALGVILQRLYASWRRKRNARLELEMERWLDSTDANVSAARSDRA